MANASGDGICFGGQDSDPTILLVLPLFLSCIWVLFDLFYSSLLSGRIVSRVAAFFLADSAVHVGRLPLPGQGDRLGRIFVL